MNTDCMQRCKIQWESVYGRLDQDTLNQPLRQWGKMAMTDSVEGSADRPVRCEEQMQLPNY